jgi:glycosyltransferase involved in cell wall biosynthesis
MTFCNYIIHHFDLAADPAPLQAAEHPAHYCVFWYRSVPLGEIYLVLPNGIDSEEFWRKCQETIWPALAHYAARLGSPLTEPAQAAPTPTSLRLICERILDGVHPQAVEHQADVSVVICTRNRASYLASCLQSLQQQHSKPVEIIVVDNGSDTDETYQVATAFGVRYIREDVPGLDVARNTGARAARASIVAYTDDDTRPDRYWVYRIFETFDNPAIFAMTGLVMAASLNTEAEVIFEKFWPFNRGYVTKRYDNGFFRSSLDSGPPVWEIGAGANMAFRKQIFEEVGYFDERLDVGAAGCSGDSELWYRVLACGFAIEYNPMAVVHHSHRSSIPGLRKQLYSYMRGFTVAILIQYQRFGHRGNLRRLFHVVPRYYLSLLKSGFPRYHFQYKTLFDELRGILSGLFYYVRHRRTDPKIYSHDVF